MRVFQWIEERGDYLFPTVKTSPGIDRLLVKLPEALAWSEDEPDAQTIVPNLAALDAVAAFALRLIASRPKTALSRSEVLYQALERLDEDSDIDDYPSDIAPENVEFVLGAFALYCLDEAIGHFANGEHAQSLDAMVEMGIALRANGYYAGEDSAAEGLRANSSKGGQARNAKYRQLEVWAVSQYRSRNWKSAHQASHELKDAVLDHAKTLGVRLSEYRAQQTIYGWFRDADKANAPTEV